MPLSLGCDTRLGGLGLESEECGQWAVGSECGLGCKSAYAQGDEGQERDLGSLEWQWHLHAELPQWVGDRVGHRPLAQLLWEPTPT